MRRSNVFQRGGDKPFDPEAHRINRLTDPEMEIRMNPIYGLILCETGYISNLYYLDEINRISKKETASASASASVSTIDSIPKNHLEIIRDTCTREHGSNIIIPTKDIMDNVSVIELGYYISIKYLNYIAEKNNKNKFVTYNETKGTYVFNQKYNKPEFQPQLKTIKKCIRKINKRIPIDDNDIFAFNMILFCVWWKANNDAGIDEYYKGIKEVFDIVNAHLPNEPRLEFNDNPSESYSESESADTSATTTTINNAVEDRDRDNDGDEDYDENIAIERAIEHDRDRASASTSTSTDSFEQLVLKITRVVFKIYNQEKSKHFCEEAHAPTYPDCGEVTARNIINILCFNGNTNKFDIGLLMEKGAIPELIEYYRVFNTFKLQSDPEPTEIFGMNLDARDAWSKLLIDKSQTNIVFNKTCNKTPNYGYDMKSGLTKDGKKPNLLQMLNNLMTGVAEWKDFTNENIITVDATNLESNGIGFVTITDSEKKKFIVHMMGGHYYVELPKVIDNINYNHLPNERQRAILDVLLKKNITEENYIEINYSSELLQKTYENFNKKLMSINKKSITTGNEINSIMNAQICLFELSTTNKYDDDLRRRLKIDTKNYKLIHRLAEKFGKNPIINKYYFLTYDNNFKFALSFPSLINLNIINILDINDNIHKKELDLSSLKNIEHIGYKFLNDQSIQNIDFSPLENLKTIGFDFLVYNKAIKKIDLSSSSQLSEIGEFFAGRCDSLQTVIFNKNANITSVGNSFLFECHGLQEIDLECFSNVKLIERNFLSNCVTLKNIKFPKSTEHIKRISDYFMLECKQLKTIDLSCFKNVETIESSFMAKSGIETIDLSKMTKLKAIGNYFMMNCENLKTIDLSSFSDIIKIGDRFLSSSAIEEIDLSHMTKLKTIDVGMGFMLNCKNLKKVILPPNLNDLVGWKNAFVGCPNVTFEYPGSGGGLTSIAPPTPPGSGGLTPTPPPGGGGLSPTPPPGGGGLTPTPPPGGGGYTLGGKRHRTTRKNKKNLKKYTRKRK